MVGTFTYDVTNNIITVTGGTAGSPVGFIDFWNADKAGTLSLHARTGISGVDASLVNLTRNARPTDRVVLGGAKQDLYVVVTAWTNMTSATVKLIGTDTSGAAQTEDLAMTDNGTYFATKYYATLTQTQVTAFSGSGSFAYEVKQGQWGVVWKMGTTGVRFDCRLVVGDGSTATYLTDSEKQVVFSYVLSANAQYYMSVKTNANATFGTLIDAGLKITSKGCQFLFLDTHYGIFGSWGTNTYYYSCSFDAISTCNVLIQGSRAYNVLLVNQVEFSDMRNGDVYNILSTRCYNGIRTWINATVSNITVMGATNAGILCGGTTDASISNVFNRGSTRLGWNSGPSNPTNTFYLINVDSDVWTFNFDAAALGKILRQYTIDIRVTDNLNNALSGATVTVKDNNGTAVFSVITDEGGSIATQTVSRGHYQKDTGNTLRDYGPHTIIISKARYQTYQKTFVLSAKVTWDIKLAKAQALLLDSGSPVVNLSPTDPENKMVLAL